MNIDQQIKDLAGRPESQGPFLTLYLDTNRGDGSRRDRVRLLMRHELEGVRHALGGNGSRAEEAIEEGIREIENYVHGAISPDARGVALFSSPAEAFFLPLQLPVEVESELSIDSRPHVRQLVALRERHPHLLVVLVDGKNARLMEIQMGEVTHEIAFENPDVPKRTDQGGWSQANIQRHIRDHINQHLKDVAERMAKLQDSTGAAGVVVSGQERNVSGLISHFSKRVQDSMLGILHLDIRATSDEIVEAAERLVSEQKKDRLTLQLTDLEAAALKNGRGALGIQPLIDAVNGKKLEQLFLSGRATARGWKCTNCSLIGESIPLGCPSCGQPVLTVDLIEQFIAAAETASAEVGLVPQASLLDRYDGVGAFLRF